MLYGSYARGDFDEESDIDIAAIVEGDRIDLQEKLKKVWDISADVGLENDVVVSPTVIPLDEFEEYQDKLPYYMNKSVLDNLVKYRLEDSEEKLESAKLLLDAGKFEKKYSKYLQSAFQIRNSCDYDDFFIASKKDAEEQYQRAREFHQEIKSYLAV